MLQTLAATSIALCVAGCGLFPSRVVRRYHGEDHIEAFLGPEDYATYLIASIAEAEGDFGHAEAGYTNLLDTDLAQAHLWTRIGACRCQQNPNGNWKRALERAEEVDPDFAPAALARSRCYLIQNKPEKAIEQAELAVSREPSYLPALKHKLELLRKYRSAAAADAFTKQVRLFAPSMDLKTGPRPVFTKRDLPKLQAALRSGNLREARRRAKESGLSPTELATAAALGGAYRLAEKQAKLVYQADPTNSRAWVAGAFGAAYGRGPKGLRDWLVGPLASPVRRPLASVPTSQDKASGWLLVAVVQFGAGEQAAQALAKRLKLSGERDAKAKASYAPLAAELSANWKASP